MGTQYGPGTVVVVPFDADGKLGEMSQSIQHTGSGPNAERQEAPHPHSINPLPGGAYALACDLGNDGLYMYPIQSDQTLGEPIKQTATPGNGPRHLALHPNQRLGYIVNELANTVSTFRVDCISGELSEIACTTTIPNDFTEFSKNAGVVVHPSGNYLFISNRGHDSIATFQIDAENETLTCLGYTPTGAPCPWDIRIDPTGRWLISANADGHTVTVFEINEDSPAKLRDTEQRIPMQSPMCVQCALI